MRLKALVLSFLILFAATAYSQESQEDRWFYPMGYLEALGSFSDVNEGDPVWGADVFGYYSPIIKLEDSLFLIPLYSVDYSRSLQFLFEDEGLQMFGEYMTQNINLALRKEFKPGWFLRLSALGTWNFANETQNESWGNGLYDYQDVGGALDLRHTDTDDQRQHDQTLGFEFYRRQYPNFTSLLSAGMPVPPERHEKDFDAYKLSYGFNRMTPDGGRLYAKPYYLYKSFIDKHLIHDDGTYDFSEKRQDHVFNLDYGFRMPLSESFFLNMENTYVFNYSNLDYYDSRNDMFIGNDVFTPNYYSYQSATLYPYIEYVNPWQKGKDLVVKLGYSYLFRYYPERKAQRANGSYKTDDQRDLEHTLYTSLTVPLTQKFDFLIRGWYTWNRSNQKFEQFYRYKYETYTAQAGFSVDF